MNASIKQLIMYAYELPGYRVAGQSWISAERYDVRAKAEGPTSKDQLRLMLRTLLANRFKLTFHHETKVLPVYWLVATQGRVHAARREGGRDAAQGRTTSAQARRERHVPEVFSFGSGTLAI
jgi:uncharacterized protein (TIGR03435 family)